MKIIDILHLAYDYIRLDENDKVAEQNRVLSDLNLQIEEGSFVCVLGHNGSGKSTLAKLLNGLNLPTEGTVFVGGMDTRREDQLWDIRRETGMVFQNPDNQIIGAVVEEDVAFGPENIGVPTAELWERVNRALEAVKMGAYRLKSPNRLSGGQKQRVAIAGTMAMLPRCIVLDEPTAMLDPSGRAEVIRTVEELNRTAGITIILITHYMEETVRADRLLVMDNGHLVMDGSPRQIFSEVQRLKAYRMDVPAVTELAWRLHRSGMPLTVPVLTREELVDALRGLLPKQTEFEPDFVKRAPKHEEITDPILRVEGLSQVYQQGTAMESHALRQLSFSVQRGSITAIIGHTGSGKSTLVQHLNGLLRGTEGRILVRFREPIPAGASGFSDIYAKDFPMKELRFKVGLVFQYPEYQLFEIDVLRDVMFGPKNQGFSEAAAKERAEEALRMVGLPEELWQKSPFELSGGEKRRAAIAGVLAMKPEILILDEPTAGLDPAGREDMFRQIESLHRQEGMTILLISHSMDDVARYAEQVLVLDQGELRMSGTPEEVFRRYRELETMGLGAPQMTYLVQELKEAGIRFESRPDTVEEAAEAILSLYRRAGGALLPDRDNGGDSESRKGKEGEPCSER